jgi:hypothetical protein
VFWFTRIERPDAAQKTHQATSDWIAHGKW